MKNIPLFDILFIAVSVGVISFITYFGYSELLSRCAVIVALSAYFVGKYTGRVELKKKLIDHKS